MIEVLGPADPEGDAAGATIHVKVGEFARLSCVSSRRSPPQTSSWPFIPPRRRALPSEPITSTVQRIQVLREDVTAKPLKREQVRDSHPKTFRSRRKRTSPLRPRSRTRTSVRARSIPTSTFKKRSSWVCAASEIPRRKESRKRVPSQTSDDVAREQLLTERTKVGTGTETGTETGTGKSVL